MMILTRSALQVAAIVGGRTPRFSPHVVLSPRPPGPERHLFAHNVCCYRLNLVARRDSCRSFKLDRAAATDLTSDDSSTLRPPPDAASRARDPPHPVMSQHPVPPPCWYGPQAEPCCSAFPSAQHQGLLACPSVPEFGASAPPSRPLAIDLLMNSASPPETVTQRPFKGFLFWVHNQAREALSAMTTDQTATSSSCQHSLTPSSCAVVPFSVQLLPSSLNNRSSQLAARRRRWGTMPQTTISDANSSISCASFNKAHIVISASCATCRGKASLGGTP